MIGQQSDWWESPGQRFSRLEVVVGQRFSRLGVMGQRCSRLGVAVGQRFNRLGVVVGGRLLGSVWVSESIAWESRLGQRFVRLGGVGRNRSGVVGSAIIRLGVFAQQINCLASDVAVALPRLAASYSLVLAPSCSVRPAILVDCLPN